MGKTRIPMLMMVYCTFLHKAIWAIGVEWVFWC